MSVCKVEQQREHFDSIAATYYREKQNPNHVLWMDMMWQKFFSGAPGLKQQQTLSVLEPMCGAADGYNILTKYVQPDIDYEGFDYSQNMVDFANRENPHLKIWQQNALTYEPKKGYDAAIMIGALHHVPNDVGNVLSRVAKALKKGGYLINSEPTSDNPIFRHVRDRIYRKNDIFDYETERDFRTKELNSFFTQNGFEIVHQIYPGLLGYVLYGNPYAFPKLNIGGNKTVKLIANMESWAYGLNVTKFFSFVTLTMCRKK